MTEPEIDIRTVTITVVIQVNTAGKQHVDVEFHPFSTFYTQLYP